VLAGGAIVVVLWAAVGTTLLGVREAPADPSAAPARARWTTSLRAAFHLEWQGHKDYRMLLVTRFCILFASFAVQSFALYFFRDALRLGSPAQAMGRVMAIVGVSVLVVAYPAGALSERWGRKRLSAGACAVCALGMALLAANHQEQWLGGLAALIGVGIGTFNSVNWAWATDLVPAAEAGKFLGLSNLATAGSAAVARLLGPAIDLANARWPYAGYGMLFVLAAVSAVVGLLVTLRMPEPRARADRA
jgi:Na+/melibiose symporter-like transporter